MTSSCLWMLYVTLLYHTIVHSFTVILRSCILENSKKYIDVNLGFYVSSVFKTILVHSNLWFLFSVQIFIIIGRLIFYKNYFPYFLWSPNLSNNIRTCLIRYAKGDSSSSWSMLHSPHNDVKHYSLETGSFEFHAFDHRSKNTPEQKFRQIKHEDIWN